jgi:uncharacterized membrane protein
VAADANSDSINFSKKIIMASPLISPSPRLQSVDLLRGAVIVLMAIDHVRVYSGLPAGGDTAGIFFTRWVTHFCVPAFVFFAGTGAFMYGKKTGSKNSLAIFLLTRGLLLILLELTVIRLAWTFNLDYAKFTLAGVIWMLGWCMILLAAFIRLPVIAIGIIGLLIIAFQDFFKYVPRIFPASIQNSTGRIWEFIYPSGLNGVPGISILYVIVPWIGVMAAGYAFGAILLKEEKFRRRICLAIGLSAIAIFIIAGCIIVSRQSSPDDTRLFLFKLLNQRKYPASQLYLLMTLGPVIALLPFAERARGWLANVLVTFGRVPMFYYLLHILLIHIAALAVMMIREGHIEWEWYATAPFTWMPDGHRWGLPLLYLVFSIVIVLLYFACRWYGKYKFDHPEKKWLKYI